MDFSTFKEIAAGQALYFLRQLGEYHLVQRLIILMVYALLAKITDLFIDHLLKRLAARTHFEADDRIIAMAGCEVTWGGFAIGNSLGVQQASRSVSNSCGTYTMVIQGEEQRTGQEAIVTREKVFDITGLGEAAAKKAVSLLEAKKLDKTAQLPTLWVPWAAASYFLASLRQSVNGRPVVEKLSPLADKLNDKIAPLSLTLIDDGQNPAGISTEAIDGEGHPQSRTPIIEKGVLKQFLFDSYYGSIFGSESTGNASRGGGPFGPSLPYEVAPSIATTNLEVFPGTKSEEELIASIDGQALLIADIPIGIFHSDVSTGEFSAVASSVFLIEAGEKQYPLQPISVAGNFYDGLKKLREIGANREITPFGMAISSLIFDGFSIVG